MKHKRHQKEKRDKSEKAPRHDEDHRYYKAEYCAKNDFKKYTMKNLSENRGDANEPKKLIIYIVNIASSFRDSLKCNRLWWSSHLNPQLFCFTFLGENWYKLTINTSSCSGASSRAQHTECQSECDSLDWLNNCHQRIISRDYSTSHYNSRKWSH